MSSYVKNYVRSQCCDISAFLIFSPTLLHQIKRIGRYSFDRPVHRSMYKIVCMSRQRSYICIYSCCTVFQQEHLITKPVGLIRVSG